MCVCCCTRKSLLISSIIITIVAIIYGIFAISFFASKTGIYKLLIEYIDYMDEYKYEYENENENEYEYEYKRKLTNSGNMYDFYDYHYDLTMFGIESIDHRTFVNIFNLNAEEYFQVYYFDRVKMLKGFEYGLGSLLFTFPALFLVAEIAYLVMICGKSENQLMKVETYYYLNIFKIITFTFSIIFIFLAFIYFIMLICIYLDYTSLAWNMDSCGIRLLIGISFGGISFLFYITLAIIFGRERSLFKKVGTVENPGERAEFDLNGNPIERSSISPVAAVVPDIAIHISGKNKQKRKMEKKMSQKHEQNSSSIRIVKTVKNDQNKY